MMVARESPPPTSGVQPSSVVSSVTPLPASEAPGDGGRHGVAEPTPRGEGVVHGRRLVAAVHHAVAALLVAAALAVVLPAGRLEQLLERRRVAFLQEVAGPLPAEHVVGRVAHGVHSKSCVPISNCRKSGYWLNRQRRRGFVRIFEKRSWARWVLRKCSWSGALA